MLLPFAVLYGLLLADVPVPAGPGQRADAIRTLAEAHAVVLVASKRCGDLSAGKEIDRLPAALGLSDADAADAFSLLVGMAGGMSATADKVGVKAWCDEAYGRFGPDGTVRKGLLERCDPHASSC